MLPRWLSMTALLFSTSLFAYSQEYASLAPSLQEEKSMPQAKVPAPNKKSLREILSALGTAYQVSFNYDDDAVKDVAFSEDFVWGKQEKLDKILKRLLPASQLKFEKLDQKNYLIYFRKKRSSSAPEKKAGESTSAIKTEDQTTYQAPASEALLTALTKDLSQLVKGIITDENNQPLPGVNILVKGTTNGTTTDAEGKFSINVADANAVLVISFIGYATQEVGAGNRTEIMVLLVPDVKALQEVVVIGYGTVKKADLTGSVSSLGSDDFNKGITTAPQQLMQGKISGVNISLNSGEPGANATVLIRGGTSISASNRPLYVIDGIPVDYNESNYITANQDRMSPFANNPLNLLNPSDIKSIDVLKDASATAIYGSRGANGVILITTKQGKLGRSVLEYDSYVSVSSIRKKIDMLTANELRDYMKTHPEIQGWTDGGANTDWQDQIFRKGVTHSHSLALSGGDNKTNYRASLSYSNQEGIIINSALQKLVGRVNINHKALNDKLAITLNLTGAQLNNKSAPVAEGTYGGGSGSIIRDALRYDPTYPVKDANGEYNYRDIFHLNPVEETNGILNENETFRFLGNVLMDYKLTSFLNLTTNLGFTKEYVDNSYYAYKTSRYGMGSGGFASQQSRVGSSKLLETNLVFNKKFGERQSINALAGYSFQEFVNANKYISAADFISDATTYNNISGGGKIFTPVTGKESNKLISFYGRVNYQYDNRYLLTVTVRRDGSTRFGANRKWGVFPSAAVAWKLSEERFLKNSNLISNLKLRVGYGITGNQEIPNYLSLKLLSAGSNTYIIGGNTIVAVGPDNNGNPDLKWESTAQANVGLDFGFFKGRLTGSLDYYEKKTADLLLTFRVPSPAEVSDITANVGEVSNKGIELELRGVVLRDGPFKWDAFANLSHNKNNVVSLSNERFKQKAIYTGSPQAPGFVGVSTQIIQPGQPLGTFFGYQYMGVNADGTEKFLDVNNDTKIDPENDQLIIGTHQPDFLYGFGSSLSFNRLTFDFSFYGIKGNKVLNATALDVQKVSELPLANVARAATTDGIKYGIAPQYSSKWIKDASFLRLENITLGYNLNVGSAKWFTRASIHLTAQNLFVLTGYSGFDPEISSGTDYTKYPRPTTLLLGFNVQF
jgi:TonB-dependent starch-binding outer membrane protein SusC